MSVSSSLPRVRKQANVCRRTINIKETQKHEKPLNNQGLFLCVPYCETKMVRVTRLELVRH